MRHLRATEAKREFGELLIAVQTEPVIIDKNGKSVAVVISDKEFRALEAFKEQFLKLAIEEGINDLQHGRVKGSNEVFEGLKSKLNDSM